MKRATLYFSAFVLGIASSSAQDGMYIDGAKVSVGSQALVFVDGNIANTGSIVNAGRITIRGNSVNTGSIDNADTITVSGDWTCKGAYTDKGMINFIGGDQTVDHYSKTFNKVSFSGGGKKTIPSGFSIASELTLEDGVLWPSDTAHIIANEASIVSPGSEMAHVNGMFYHAGTGNNYYPIGKDGVFLPMEMDVFTGSSPVVGFEVFNDFSTQPKGDKSIIEIETEHYWKRDQMSGTIDSATLALPYTEREIANHNAQVILQAPHLDSIFRSTTRRYGYDAKNLTEMNIPHIANEKKITGSYFALGIEQLLDVRLRYIPNALSRFAPNPEDRVIKVYGNLFSDRGFSFKVINQWGNVVFDSNDVEYMENFGWDGVNSESDKHEMAGQYHYVFRAQYKDGIRYEEAGALYIIE